MKRILLLQLFLFTAFGFAQVGVNTTTPHPSSMLDVTATNKGALFPRVSLSNINVTLLDGTNTAATGLLIWNTNAATIGGNGVGYYFFNGTIWVPIMQTASSDHDWYEIGTTTAPNAITDNIFTQGNVTVGSSTASGGKVSVYNSTLSASLYSENSTSIANSSAGGYFLNSGTGTFPRYGTQNVVSGSGSGQKIAVYNEVNANSTDWQTGVFNLMNGSNANFVYGTRNQMNATGSGTQTQVGVYSDFSTVSDSSIFGTYNFNISNGNGTHYGIQNRIIGSGNGQKFGSYNFISGNGSGVRYGSYNILGGTGAGAKYGTYNYIDMTAGGVHYGIYSDVLKAGSYAGYFLGDVSIGTTTVNNYILPPSRGTNGQLMQTDGAGNVSWINASAIDTDNQIIDVLSLTGDVLNISLQDDGVATQTLNLAAIDNQATDVFSLTGTTLNLSLQNDGVPTQTVNLASLVGTDDQNLVAPTLVGTTLNLNIENGTGTSIDLAPLQDGTGTDDQTIDNFSLSGTTLRLSLENDGQPLQTVNLASLVGTDDQNLTTPTLVGTTLNLNIENGLGTSIDLAPLQDGTGTDDQNIQNLALNATTNILTVGIENGTSQTVNLTSLKEWTDVGASIHPADGITEEVTIGTLAAGTGKLTINANEMASGIDIEKSGNFAVQHFGIDNYVSNEGGGGSYGIRNILEGSTGANMRYAVYNEINGVSSPTNISHYGIYNNITSTGTGTRYGSYNSVSGSGTGNKFGTYNIIPITSTGDHYGIYSEALRTTGNVWAGYFLGNVAIGTTTANTYNFPASRGTNGQIMQTDATGVVSWVNAPTAESTTANNGLTETVNNVQLGGALVQNTTLTQGTFNMDINLTNTGDFSIQDNGTDVLFVEDTGEIGIGTNTPLYPLHMIENGVVDNAFFLDKTETSANNTSGIFINKTGLGTGRSHAIFTDVDGTGTGQKYGVFNQISSAAAGNQYGTRNFISGNSPSSQFGTFNNLDNAGTGIHYGNYNGMRGTSAATLYANYNEFDNVTTAANSYGNYTSFSANATGTGDKYGTYNTINTAVPGTHYGTFNSVGVANGWAGYFLGRNYISDREAIGETDNPNAGLSINKNSTGTYSHIELKEATANDGARLSFSNTAEATNNWLLFGRADNTITDSRFNIFHTTTGNIMQITGDGLVGILRTPTTNQLEINGTASKAAAGAFIANSDSRLKKNIATISPTEALEKVLSLRGVTYEWNDNKTGMNRPEGIQLGFVAQEIQQVFPEKVTEDKQGYLQTAYGDYDPIIFQAIKALSDKIDKLEKENEELKKRIEDKK